MNYIKPVITYKLSHAVELMKTIYNFRVGNLNNSDVVEINEILNKINPNVEICSSGFFINGKTIKFQNKEGESINFEDNCRWKIIINIHGFKKKNGCFSSNWSIAVAKKVL